jgi:hypothetical protein
MYVCEEDTVHFTSHISKLLLFLCNKMVQFANNNSACLVHNCIQHIFDILDDVTCGFRADVQLRVDVGSQLHPALE